MNTDSLIQQPGLTKHPSWQIAAHPELTTRRDDIVENTALRMTNLGKCYRRYARQWDRVRQWLGGQARQYYQEHWALRHLDLTIARGTTVGILGANGSGKSTLLQLMAGTLTPSEGQLEIGGRVAALLELGSGFHPEFTGWENIRLQASLMGLDEEEIKDKLPGIARFSELESALDQPLRTYSSGMILRLGFSVAISVNPDILLVDEALSVGDMHFQMKCMSRIQNLREQGVTILLVTHDIGTTKRLCDEAHVLEKGTLVQSGKTEQVCNWYVARMIAGTGQTVPSNGIMRHGNGKAVLQCWQLLDAQSLPTTHCKIGEHYVLRVKLRLHEKLEQPVLGFYLRDRFGTELLGTNTEHAVKPIRGEAGSAATVDFSFSLHVRPGTYTLCLGLVDCPSMPTCLDWIDDALVLQVHDPIPGRVVHGLFAESIDISITQ